MWRARGLGLHDVRVAEGSGLDQELLAEITARIDATCGGAVTIDSVFDRLELAEDDKNTPLAAVAMAFLYKTREPSKENPCFFGPWVQMTDGSQYPPVLPDVTPDIFIL